MGSIFPWAPVSSLAFNVVFLLPPCGRFTWMDTNTSCRLDSDVPCVKFAMVIDSKTMDSKAVGAVAPSETFTV